MTGQELAVAPAVDSAALEQSCQGAQATSKLGFADSGFPKKKQIHC